jgi:hypothetical protein
MTDSETDTVLFEVLIAELRLRSEISLEYIKRLQKYAVFVDERLVELDIQYIDPKYIFEHLEHFYYIESLKIGHTDGKLTVPHIHGMKHLLNLKKLTIRNMKIENKVLEQIICLSQLIELEIAFCNVSEFPKSPVNLPKILYLGLPGNKLEELPSPLCMLNTIRNLDLSFNQFKDVPDLDTFKNLEQVSLWMNYIKRIPDAIMKHPTLRKIDFSGNPVALQKSIVNYHSKRIQIIFSKSEIFK